MVAAPNQSGRESRLTATGLPAGTSINAGTGAITGTPTAAGTSTVTVTAKDGSGAAASASFVWTVAPAGSSGTGATGQITGYQGLCLDVRAANSADGTPVQVYTCNGTGAQVWQPQSNGALVNPQSGKCLDDTGFGGSGTQVQIWSCTGGTNQVWALP